MVQHLHLSDCLITAFLLNIFPVVIKQQTTVTDKVKHRLEQLDDFEEVIVLNVKCFQ